MHIRTSDQETIQLGIGNCSCNWGSHICGLYDTDGGKNELIYGFLGEGLLDEDRGFHVTQMGDDEFRADFAKYRPDSASKISDPQILATADPLDLYCPNGNFDPIAMEHSLVQKFADSQRSGPSKLRSIGDMSWATQKIPGIEHLMAYESRLNYVVPDKPWVTICLYDVRKFSGAFILSVLQTHPVAISGGVITKNPFFIHPDVWLSRYAPQFQ